MQKRVSQRRGGRPATGSVQFAGGRWRARITLDDGRRRLVDLDPALAPEDEAGARAAAAEVAALARDQRAVSCSTVETVREYAAGFARVEHLDRDDLNAEVGFM